MPNKIKMLAGPSSSERANDRGLARVTTNPPAAAAGVGRQATAGSTRADRTPLRRLSQPPSTTCCGFGEQLQRGLLQALTRVRFPSLILASTADDMPCHPALW